MKQGYQAKQITVITMYRGQESFIRKNTRQLDQFKEMKVTSVDNFQGILSVIPCVFVCLFVGCLLPDSQYPVINLNLT